VSINVEQFELSAQSEFPHQVVTESNVNVFRVYEQVREMNKKLDEVLEFINILKSGIGNAQNAGGPMAMMARGLLPDFSQE
jgi:hypothetical protein